MGQPEGLMSSRTTMTLPHHYYPTYWSGCNPIHEVHDWCKVRKLIRDARKGDPIPPILVESLGNGNLLTGTHRAAANDIVEMLGGEALIPAQELEELPEDIQAEIMMAIDNNQDDYIDDILEAYDPDVYRGAE